MIIPIYEIHVELMICFHFTMIPYWSLFLSHSVRLILSDVVVIL